MKNILLVITRLSKTSEFVLLVCSFVLAVGPSSFEDHANERACERQIGQPSPISGLPDDYIEHRHYILKGEIIIIIGVL
jgi:hypothetical protein